MGEIKKLMEIIKQLKEENAALNKSDKQKEALTPVKVVQNVQSQRPKEPSELQQVHVRKLIIAIETMCSDFKVAKQKCSEQQNEENRIASEVDKARHNLGRLPKVDNPEYIKYKKIRWEQAILLACNQYFKTLNQFQLENEGFVNSLRLFQGEMKRVLRHLVSVQPLPESMISKNKEESELFNLDAPIEEAAKHVKKIILKPIPEIGVKQPTVQLSTDLDEKVKMATKEKTGTVIEIVSPSEKTDNQEVTEELETKPVKLNEWDIKLREKYSEAALNPLLPENAEVVIYTDGSLISTNKNTEEKIDSGGYAAILIFRKIGDAKITISGHKVRPSGADYMELLAISKALKRLKKYKIEGKVVLYSDALNIVNNYNTKLAGWKECGWKREKDGKYVRYWKLWKKIWKLTKKLDLRVCWVKGHAESKLNRKCDAIARAEARLRAI